MDLLDEEGYTELYEKIYKYLVNEIGVNISPIGTKKQIIEIISNHILTTTKKTTKLEQQELDKLLEETNQLFEESKKTR